MMTTDLTIQFIIRLAVAGLLGALIGLDRNTGRKRPAPGPIFSFRSAARSSSSFRNGDSATWSDIPASGSTRAASRRRWSAGIGFIGAGTIMMQKQFVRGLTTAAGLWATAGIGLAIGGRTLYCRHRGNPADADRARSAPLPAAELPEQMLDRQIRDP